VWLQGDELGAKRAEPVPLDRRAIMDANVMAIDPAEIPEGLAEYGHAARNLRIGFRQSHQHADVAEPPDGLPERGHWPKHHGAGQQSEYLTASHAIHLAMGTELSASALFDREGPLRVCRKSPVAARGSIAQRFDCCHRACGGWHCKSS